METTKTAATATTVTPCGKAKRDSDESSVASSCATIWISNKTPMSSSTTSRTWSSGRTHSSSNDLTDDELRLADDLFGLLRPTATIFERSGFLHTLQTLAILSIFDDTKVLVALRGFLRESVMADGTTFPQHSNLIRRIAAATEESWSRVKTNLENRPVTMVQPNGDSVVSTLGSDSAGH